MSKSTVTRCPGCGAPLQVSTIGPGSPEPATFEQSAASIATGGSAPVTSHRHSFWDSSGIRFGVAGVFAAVVVLFVGWFFELDRNFIGAAAALLALLAGVGLHILELFWHKPPAQMAAPEADSVTIRIEQRGTDENKNGWLLEQIEDQSITLADLRAVATAVAGGSNFSRPALCSRAGISQSKYHKVKTEFLRLNFCYDAPGNRTELLRAGRAFLRQIETLAD